MHLATTEHSAAEAESDEDLLLAVHAGDPAEREPAAAAFYDRYASDLHEYVRRTYAQVLGPEGVGDLVIRAFHKAFKGAGSYRAASDPTAARARTFSWLATIADRTFNDWLRSPDEATPLPLREIGKNSVHGRKHGTAVDLDHLDLESDEPDDSASDPDPLLFSEEGRRLRDCLEELSDRDRELVLLYGKYWLPDRPLRIDTEERAALLAKLGMKSASFSSVLRRARERLERCCGRHGDP